MSLKMRKEDVHWYLLLLSQISDDDGGDGDLQSSKVGANFDFDVSLINHNA